MQRRRDLADGRHAQLNTVWFVMCTCTSTTVAGMGTAPAAAAASVQKRMSVMPESCTRAPLVERHSASTADGVSRNDGSVVRHDRCEEPAALPADARAPPGTHGEERRIFSRTAAGTCKGP